MVTICSRENIKDTPNREELELKLDWGWSWGGLDDIFFIFQKNIKFEFSQINLLHLGNGALTDRPTSSAARKENFAVNVLTESNRKPQNFSSCEEVPVLI